MGWDQRFCFDHVGFISPDEDVKWAVRNMSLELRPQNQESSLFLSIPTPSFFLAGPVNFLISYSLPCYLSSGRHPSRGLDFFITLLTSLLASSFPSLQPIFYIVPREF